MARRAGPWIATYSFRIGEVSGGDIHARYVMRLSMALGDLRIAAQYATRDRRAQPRTPLLHPSYRIAFARACDAARPAQSTGGPQGRMNSSGAATRNETDALGGIRAVHRRAIRAARSGNARWIQTSQSNDGTAPQLRALRRCTTTSKSCGTGSSIYGSRPAGDDALRSGGSCCRREGFELHRIRGCARCAPDTPILSESYSRIRLTRASLAICTARLSTSSATRSCVERSESVAELDAAAPL